MEKLPLSYYLNDNVEDIAMSLLGKIIYSRVDSVITAGIITETEAYKGVGDKASHAYGGRFTKRTEVMYKRGGISYVYQCYGIHFLFNVVTADINIPHAVLIRGIFPIIGIKLMLERTGKSKADYNLTNGPGKVTKALGLNISHNNISLHSDKLWIENGLREIRKDEIIIGPRIGVDYAGEDALLPFRYIVKMDTTLLKDFSNLVHQIV